jgi:hypothetical protein
METSRVPHCQKVQIDIQCWNDDVQYAWCHTIWVIPHGTTANIATYQKSLKWMRGAVHCKQPDMISKEALLLHDNAWPYTAASMKQLMDMWRWDFLHYPLFRLASSDQFKDLRMPLDEGVKEDIRTWLSQ